MATIFNTGIHVQKDVNFEQLYAECERIQDIHEKCERAYDALLEVKAQMREYTSKCNDVKVHCDQLQLRYNAWKSGVEVEEEQQLKTIEQYVAYYREYAARLSAAKAEHERIANFERVSRLQRDNKFAPQHATSTTSAVSATSATSASAARSNKKNEKKTKKGAVKFADQVVPSTKDEIDVTTVNVDDVDNETNVETNVETTAVTNVETAATATIIQNEVVDEADDVLGRQAFKVKQSVIEKNADAIITWFKSKVKDTKAVVNLADKYNDIKKMLVCLLELITDRYLTDYFECPIDLAGINNAAELAEYLTGYYNNKLVSHRFETCKHQVDCNSDLGGFHNMMAIFTVLTLHTFKVDNPNLPEGVVPNDCRYGVNCTSVICPCHTYFIDTKKQVCEATAMKIMTFNLCIMDLCTFGEFHYVDDIEFPPHDVFNNWLHRHQLNRTINAVRTTVNANVNANVNTVDTKKVRVRKGKAYEKILSKQEDSQ